MQIHSHRARNLKIPTKFFEKPSKIDVHITHFMSDDEIKKLAEETMNV